MLKNKKSKSVRMRGTSSHGWGHKKKHRGAGHRGGVGLAGTGKRGDVKKCSVLTNALKLRKSISASKGIKLAKVQFGQDYFGKRGFTSIKTKKQNVLSLSYIENNFENMIDNGLIVKNKDELILDTVLLKYDKVLGKGKFTRKINFIVNSISASAQKRIEELNGKVEIKSSAISAE